MIRNLQQVIDAGEPHGLTPILTRRRPVRYYCSCGALVPAGQLMDCRSTPTVGQPWACDGCISTWQREGIAKDGGGPPVDSKEWRIRWAQMHGAPQGVVDKLSAMRDKAPYRRG